MLTYLQVAKMASVALEELAKDEYGLYNKLQLQRSHIFFFFFCDYFLCYILAFRSTSH